MSLDERVRSGLRISAEWSGLDADEVLASVEVAHARGVARSRLMRQAASVAVVLALFAGVAAVVSLRAGDDRTASPSGSYRSTATVRIGPAPGSTPLPPGVKLSDPRALALALAASTRRAALTALHLAPDVRIDFRATLNPTGDVLSLDVTAPTASESTSVARSWAAAFTVARRTEALTAITAEIPSVNSRIAALHELLLRVDAKLVKVDPATFRNIARYDAPNSNLQPGHDPRMPPVPESASVGELNLANEREQLLSELSSDGSDAASIRVTGLNPEVFATIIGQTPAIEVKKASHAQSHALAWWILGLAVVLAGALLVYRLRTRSLRQLPAKSR